MDKRIFLSTFGKCIMILYGTLFFMNLMLAIIDKDYNMSYKPDWMDLVYIVFTLGLSLHNSTKIKKTK